MSSKKKAWIIGGIIGGVLLLAILILVGWFALGAVKKFVDKNVPPTWLKAYEETLTDTSSDILDYDDVYVQIVDIKNTKDSIPALILRYDDYYYDDGMIIYQSDKNGNLSSKSLDSDSSLVVLYNRETKEYELFKYTYNYSYYSYYDAVYESLEDEDKVYRLEDGEYEDENGDYKKFDSLYVTATTLNDWVELDDLDSINSKELISILMREKNKEKTVDTYVTDDVKESVNNQVKALEKKEEEEKKALEEKKKKEEEEAKTTYKTKNYSLKYGVYKITNMPEYSLEITLSPEGVCHYKGISDSNIDKTYDEDCTYSVVEQEYYGVMTEFLKFELKSGATEYFQLSKDNAFNSQWLSLEYVG